MACSIKYSQVSRRHGTSAAPHLPPGLITVLLEELRGEDFHTALPAAAALSATLMSASCGFFRSPLPEQDMHALSQVRVIVPPATA